MCVCVCVCVCVTLDHKTLWVLSCWGIFVAIVKINCMVQKFYFMLKIIYQVKIMFHEDILKM